MNSIELMMEEHKNILRMLIVVRSGCYQILKGEDISYDDFDLMIDFIRNYADAHHHGKEEKFLFNRMVEQLGQLGNKLVTHGMLVEHDLGRLFIQELQAALERVKAGEEESKLDVIANAISYTHLLKRHIEKEDTAVYSFAERNLSPEVMEKVNHEAVEYEAAAEEKGTPQHYIVILEQLECKYC